MMSNRIGITSRGDGRGGRLGLRIRERATAALRGLGHLELRNRRVGGIVAAAATAVVLPATALATAPQALAATTYQGKVTTSALNIRSAPTGAAADVGTLRLGATVTIQCKVFGPSVAGNTLWYKLSTRKWVTARYVANVGPAPRFCGDGQEYEGRVVVSTLNVRSGPNTANATVSSAHLGTLLPLVCKVDSQAVDGNTRWYQLTGDSGGQWVAARYVSNVGSAPPYC